VDKLYILDCGQGYAPDESRWTVGVNVGKPIAISVSCYLIHHAQGYFLWDTGISDQVAAMPDGWLPTNNPANDIHWTRAKTLESQLAKQGDRNHKSSVWCRLHLNNRHFRHQIGGNLNTQEIVRELKAEIDRLQRAVAALDGANTTRTIAATAEPSSHGARASRRGHHITAAGRKRLSMLMKKRWAERRKRSSTGQK
jgi:hypothetical protein